MVFALVTSVGEGIMSTLFTPFVEHVLHGTPQDLGLSSPPRRSAALPAGWSPRLPATGCAPAAC